MNQNSFDEHIRNAAEHIGNNFQPKNWDLLEQRLNEMSFQAEEEPSLSAEEQFDLIIREKIAAKKPNYNPNHWVLMSSIIDEYFSIAAWLRRYKVLEIGLTSLFVFTFINVFYIPARFDDFAINQSVFNTNLGEKKAAVEKRNSTFIAENATGNQSFLVQKDKKILSNQLQNKVNTSENVIFESNAISNNENIVSEKIGITTNDFLPKTIVENIEKLPILATSNVKEQEKNLDFALVKTILPLKRQKWAFEVGVLSSLDLNYISTPERYFYDTYTPALKQETNNINAGVFFEASKNRCSFQVGFLYGKKIYSAAKTRFGTNNGNITTNSITLNLDNIQMNMVQIPTMFTFDVLKQKRLSSYLAVGASMNIITEARYDYSRQSLGFVIRPTTVAGEKPPFTDGYLVSKTIRGNTFFTGNIGVGVDYKLNNQVSIFNQIQYRQLLSRNGLGTNGDKINNLSFLLGVKKQF